MYKKIVLLIILTLILVGCSETNIKNKSPEENVLISVKYLDALEKKDALSFDEIYKYLEDEGFDSEELEAIKNSNSSNTNAEVYYQFFSLESIEVENENLVPEILVGLDYTDSETPKKIVSLNGARINDTKNYTFHGKIQYFLESGNSFFVVTSGDIYKNKDYIKGIDIQENELGMSAIVNISILNEEALKHIKNIYEDERGYFPNLDSE